jgi:uncharacterized hydrophobic protein (TIGR00271 family)
MRQERKRSRLSRWVQPLSRERRVEVLETLFQSSSPNFDYYLLIVLSTSIATFGLITNSNAVVIGAMLVAPLMSPILGLSLASVAGEERIFERALAALIWGIVLAIALSTGIGWISHALPFGVLDILPSEVVSRTRPTPFDLGIALAGGAAAAYALAQPQLSAALPGVAIATALVPPLCTMGIGIALRRYDVVIGAFLLFTTNLVAISFSGILVFAALGFRPRLRDGTWFRLPRSVFISAGLVLFVTIPLIALTLNFVNQGRQERAARELEQEVHDAVTAELAVLPNNQLVDIQIIPEDSVLGLVVTVRSPQNFTYQQVVALQKGVATRLQRPISLQLIDVPMIQLNPLNPPTFTPTATLGPNPTPIPITPTRTPAPPTPTFTITPTVTPTFSATPTFTSTPTFTPTPVLAYIANTGGLGIYLREAPAGKIISALPEGAAVQILYQRELVNNLEWIQVRDIFERIGWIPLQFVVIKP